MLRKVTFINNVLNNTTEILNKCKTSIQSNKWLTSLKVSDIISNINTIINLENTFNNGKFK
jgi:hypothetical protein